MKHLSNFLLLLALSIPSAKAQEPDDTDPYEWVIESYEFPSDELAGGFASEERGELRAPPLPPGNATEEEIEDFIKKSSSVVTHYLEMQGLSLPKGSLVLYDAESMTLTGRLPRIAHASVAFTAEAYSQYFDTFLSLDPVLVEAPAPLLRSIVSRLHEKGDHSELVEEIEAEIDAGNAKILSKGRIDANSGQRSKIEQVEEITYPVDFAVAPDGTIEYESETLSEGTVWEVDPVIGADEETIDLNIALRNNFAPTVENEVPLNNFEEKEVSIQSMEIFNSSITSQYTLISDTARVLGVWKPHVAGLPATETLHAAFVRANVVRVLPLPNENLARYLRDHGDAVMPIPEGELEFKKAAEEIPEGMIVRRFRIPPTFLSAGMAGRNRGAPAADPFAAPAGEPTFTIKATAKDILQAAGISFPEGSSANYIPATSTLVIRNTPEQIALVEAYVMSISAGVERSIGVTAHLVQAPSSLLREATNNTRGLADHRDEWERLQEADGFSILSTNWIEGRSGQRAKVETRKDFQIPGAAYLSYGLDSPKTEKGAIPDRAPAYLTGDFVAESIGTSLEIDPVLGADQDTVDINVTFEHDYAPPSIAGPPEGPEDENKLVLEGPTTRFHRANVLTSTTMRSGMIRLVGIWTPEGTPEFDNANITQGLFIKVDVVPVSEEEL